MVIRKPWLWIAAAVTAAVTAYATVLLQDDKDGQAPQASGPELFSFVKALPADPPANATVAPGGSAETTAQVLPIRHDPAAVMAANAFRIEEEVRRMRAQGASDDEVYRARAAVMNPEKAAALARLDREEAAWQQRVSAYLAQRQALGGNVQAIQALKDGLFTAEEQARLSAYEPAVAPLTGMPVQ